MNRLLTALAFAAIFLACQSDPDIMIEAESFAEKGGWVIDNQSDVTMGSPYLLAHGMGIPVADAKTTFKVGKAGDYRVWVRTRDWVKSCGKAGSPGRFEILLNGNALSATFGTESADWDWQDGGVVTLAEGENEIALRDLTGFEGRCDVIYLTRDLEAGAPVNDVPALDKLRHKLLGITKPEDGGTYDGRYMLCRQRRSPRLQGGLDSEPSFARGQQQLGDPGRNDRLCPPSSIY